MRLRPLVFVALASSLALSSAARADFDPWGKKKKKPPVVVPNGGGGGTKPVTVTSGSASASATAPGKDPFRKATIIALARPGESGPVLKLAQLYRERDGNLDKGLADWKTRAADTSASDEERWAAQIVYAGLLKSDKREKEAEGAYATAIAQKPDRPVAIVALARLKQDAGDLGAAYAGYEKALGLEKDKVVRESDLRTLMELAIDLKKPIEAKKWHGELVKANGDSMTVRAELARAYFRKAQYESAEAEYKEVVKAAAGDNRTLPAALLDLGNAQIKLQKWDDAVATLKKALGLAGAEAGVRPRLLNAIAEAYRAQNKIELLVADLEKEKPSDVDRQELIGKLAAEFDADKAILWLGKALATAPTRVDSRVLLIRLLKEQSRLDEALKQYDLLINAAKGQPQYVFDLCDLLIGRGERAKALARLKQVEASAGSDTEVLQRLGAYYSQIGEDKLALALMERLAQKSGDDPSYVVDLGDYYYQRAQNAKAKEIWQKLLVLIKPKAKAYAALGEVYLDHDLGDDALEAYKQALELAPGEVPVLKGYAAALERTHKYDPAQAIWESLLGRNDVDKATRREARSHLVMLWIAQKKLDAQVAPLTEKFKGAPPDLEAGRLLSEVLLHLRKLADAEKILRSIIEAAPGDIDARLVLERTLVSQGQVGGAIKVLEELVRADPKGARAYYTRLAQYALSLYRDEDAVRWAAAAVELSPEDADGHKKLAELYRSQQDFPRAIKEFKLALSHNPKLWTVYFELAELLLAAGEEVEADVLYRRVMRGSNDDDLVGSAIRLSAAINQKRGTLEVLETELLPIALGSPQKAVYRRLLIEVYANMTAPLIHTVRTSGPDAPAAAAKLVKIGARGVQPLIDALSDADVAQQRIAIEILAFVQNKSAGAPLFAFATGTAPLELRTRAMYAAGALRDVALLPKIEAWLFPKGPPMPKDSVATGAVFALARLDDKRVPALLTRVVESAEAITPEMRIYGVLGLGRIGDKAALPVIERFHRTRDGGRFGAPAALWAMGQVGDPSSRSALLAALETGTDPLERRAAMLAIVRMQLAGGGKGEKVKRVAAPPPESLVTTIAEAAFHDDAALSKTAASALAALAVGELREPGDPLAVPDGSVTGDSIIAGLAPAAYSASELGKALVTYERAISGAATTALVLSNARAATVLGALLSRSEGPSLGAFTAGVGDARPSAEVLAAAGRVGDAVEGLVAAKASGEDVPLALRAIRWLGRRDSAAARAALVDALLHARDRETLISATLEQLGARGDAGAVAAIAARLSPDEPWNLRVQAARALGEIGRRAPDAAVVAPLVAAARGDKTAFVREAAVTALMRAGRPEGRATVEAAAKADDEPRVRKTASDLLAGKSSGG
jgi:tetratricopeptide (TPR) repeat protein/HEAT repeat protein